MYEEDDHLFGNFMGNLSFGSDKEDDSFFCANNEYKNEIINLSKASGLSYKEAEELYNEREANKEIKSSKNVITSNNSGHAEVDNTDIIGTSSTGPRNPFQL